VCGLAVPVANQKVPECRNDRITGCSIRASSRSQSFLECFGGIPHILGEFGTLIQAYPGDPMNKAIITVVGQDTVGIIARVCTYLSEHKANVLDISQTIIDGFFNMMMIVDYASSDKEFGDIVADLEGLGDEIGVRIRCQREEIFTGMHRV
jgi:ACT domain-containing protein